MKVKSFLIVLLVLSGLPILSGADSKNRDYWPTTEWRISSPSQQGIDSKKFEDLQNYIEEELPMTTSVLVIRHGYIVFEKYYMGDQGTPRVIWSATKSVVSALIGIAIREGYLKNVHQKMMEFFPEYVSTDMNPEVNKITILHLLTMSGGIAKDEDDDGFSQAILRETLRNDPGKEFFYSNRSPDILSLIRSPKPQELRALISGKNISSNLLESPISRGRLRQHQALVTILVDSDCN